jgi:asparagine synthase (glutamine-hydrolysing)
MGRHIPAAITDREKQGFSAPDASWFKGDSIDYVRRKLYQGNPRIYEFLDREAVQGLVNEHLDGKQNRRLLIWSLLNLEKWCESFFA